MYKLSNKLRNPVNKNNARTKRKNVRKNKRQPIKLWKKANLKGLLRYKQPNNLSSKLKKVQKIKGNNKVVATSNVKIVTAIIMKIKIITSIIKIGISQTKKGKKVSNSNNNKPKNLQLPNVNSMNCLKY